MRRVLKKFGVTMRTLAAGMSPTASGPAFDVKADANVGAGERQRPSCSGGFYSGEGCDLGEKLVIELGDLGGVALA